MGDKSSLYGRKWEYSPYQQWEKELESLTQQDKNQDKTEKNINVVVGFSGKCS